MMKTERPLWGRGIMVSPQHFQQQAAYAAWTAEVIARMGLNHPWGVVEATFEPEMLKLGRLQAHRLQVRFQDGTMINTDNADALPSALSLDGASGEAVIVLALPLMQANGGNCLKPEEVAERPVRFRQRWRDVRNQFGDDTRQIAVIQPELILRFAHQDNSDYLTCPLVRLQRDSQGAWLIDETFLPPLLQIQGSRWLARQLNLQGRALLAPAFLYFTGLLLRHKHHADHAGTDMGADGGAKLGHTAAGQLEILVHVVVYRCNKLLIIAVEQRIAVARVNTAERVQLLEHGDKRAGASAALVHQLDSAILQGQHRLDAERAAHNGNGLKK